MPTFKEDGKQAKTLFQTTTQKKKPSEKFMGAFNKGSGIGSALESADSAKTAGDLQKAMASFHKAYMEYLQTLEKAIADPKTTPVADKTVYAGAVKKLKQDLQAIHDSAHGTMQHLVEAGANKKDKVDPAQLRKWADGEKAMKLHTSQREALAETLKKTLASYKSKGVEGPVTNAIKQFDAAKSAKASGNTVGADVAAHTSQRFAEQATTMLKEMREGWTNLSTTGEMVRLRLDGPLCRSAAGKKGGICQRSRGSLEENRSGSTRRDLLPCNASDGSHPRQYGRRSRRAVPHRQSNARCVRQAASPKSRPGWKL